MYVRVGDGIPEFAIGIFVVESDEITLREINELSIYAKNNNQIITYKNYEYNLIVEILNKYNLSFIYNKINTNELIEKTKNIKFNSPKEVINFLEDNIEPESQIIPNLKNDKDLLGKQLISSELSVLGLQQENQILGQQLVNLELKLLELSGE